MGTVATPTPPPPPPPPPTCSSCGPKFESLTDIDITKLSQSELYALSMCSDFAFDLHRTDDVVLPNIDRTIFNESAGSRRQTYSRLRDNRHHHLHPRTRLPGLLPCPKLSPSSDPENHSILHFLKHYVDHDSSSGCPPPPPPPVVVPGDLQPQVGLGLQERMALAVHVVEKKRKRVQKRANRSKGLLENGMGMELQRVNKNGKVVDFAALESTGDDFYGAELWRRTMGLQTEEGFLDFLRGLEGEWCSRRRKRKYVDASEFGDALPIGWKLLLGLKRRDGRVWVYCRRTVSPTGEQLLSCKEAASFLRSYFEAKGVKQLVDHQMCLVEQAGAMASGSGAGFVQGADYAVQELGSGSSSAYLTDPLACGKEVCSIDLDNLPEVPVQDLFECYKCNLSFDKKNAYLQHLMSFHQQTTRRFKFGNIVSDGVMIKEGTFECQFCHKVFHERSSYNVHVTVHSRNQTECSEELPAPDYVPKTRESPSREVLSPRTSEINTLTEFAQNSMVVAPSAGISSAAFDNSGHSIMNSDETLAGHPHHRPTMDSDPTEIEELKADRTLEKDLSRDGSECIVADGETMEIDGRQSFETNQIEACKHDSEQSDAKEIKEYRNSNIEKGFGHRSSELSDDAANTKGLAGDENVLRNGNTSSSSVPLVQHFEYFSSISDKGGNEFFVNSQKLGNLTGFEELELDEMECDFVDGNERQELSISLPGVSTNLASDTGMEQGLSASVGFDTKEAQSNMTGTHEFTTVCVWCRSEFKVEAFESEMQLDSIGYMCTTCKDNISGHFDRICS